MKIDILRNHIRLILLEGRGEFIFNEIWSFIIKNLTKIGNFSGDQNPISTTGYGAGSKWDKVPGQKYGIFKFDKARAEPEVKRLYLYLKERYPDIIPKDWGSTYHFLLNFISTFEIRVAKKNPRGAHGTYYGHGGPDPEGNVTGKILDNLFLFYDSSAYRTATAALRSLENNKTAVHEFAHGVQTALYAMSPASKEIKKNRKGKPGQRTEALTLIANTKFSPGNKIWIEYLAKLIADEDDNIKIARLGENPAFAIKKTSGHFQSSSFGGWAVQKHFEKLVKDYFLEDDPGSRQGKILDLNNHPDNVKNFLRSQLQQNHRVPPADDTDQKVKVTSWWRIMSNLDFTSIPGKDRTQVMREAIEDAAGPSDDYYFVVVRPKSSIPTSRKSRTPKTKNLRSRGGKDIPRKTVQLQPRSKRHNKYNFQDHRGISRADANYNLGYSGGSSANTGDKWNRQLTEFDAEFRAGFRKIAKKFWEFGIPTGIRSKLLAKMIDDNIEEISKILVDESNVLNMFKSGDHKFHTDVINDPNWNYRQKAEERFNILSEKLVDILNSPEVEDVFEETSAAKQGFEQSAQIVSSLHYNDRVRLWTAINRKIKEEFADLFGF